MPTKLHGVTFEKTVIFRRRNDGTECVISGFRGEVDENCLLSYYAVSSSNFLSTFRNNFKGPIFKGQDGTDKFEDRTGKLSRKVGKKLPLLAA